MSCQYLCLLHHLNLQKNIFYQWYPLSSLMLFIFAISLLRSLCVNSPMYVWVLHIVLLHDYICYIWFCVCVHCVAFIYSVATGQKLKRIQTHHTHKNTHRYLHHVLDRCRVYLTHSPSLFTHFPQNTLQIYRQIKPVCVPSIKHIIALER